MAEPATGASAWDALRARAAARAAALGVPDPARGEDWRYVDVKPLAAPPAHAPRGADAAAVARHCVGDAPPIVLVDGRWLPELSARFEADARDGVAVDDLARTGDGDAWRARWTSAIDSCDDVGGAWSLADLASAIRIRARGAGGAAQLLSLATGARSGARVVVDVAANAELHLTLVHAALAPSRSAIALDVALGANARLVVDELQHAVDGVDAGILLPSATIDVGRDARCAWTTSAVGGALVRFRTIATLGATGGAVELAGVASLDGARQAHTWLRVEHRVGPTTSKQLFKTIADGESRASFDGLVRIAKGADGSAAEQLDRNLLLSRRARVDARPQLDILADEVKASHGATIGQASPDELFYLRSRGLTAAQAQSLLVRGFAAEVVALHSHDAARARAARILGIA